MKATTKDLRLRTRELIAITDRGEEVTITYRGKNRARLVPLRQTEPAEHRADQNPAFGIWKDMESSVQQQVDSVRAPRSFD